MYVCVPCPWRPEEGVRPPGAEVGDGCEPPCGGGGWGVGSNTGPFEERPVLLTIEPSV